MKKLLTILAMSSCLAISAQDDLEIKGTIVNNQNQPVKEITVSVPSAFLRTVTGQDGKFNLSLANMNYGANDMIQISNNDNNKIIEMSIGDYLKLDNKKFVVNNGSSNTSKKKKVAKTTKTKKEKDKYSEAKKTTLALNEVKKGDKISIKNKNGKTFLKETITSSNIKNKEFDLNFLADGNYFFEIERELKINIIPFMLSFDKGIIYLKQQETVLYKPHIKVENEMVILTQISQNGAPISIDIYDENNELLYNDTTKDELDIQRAFKLKKGNFKFVITSNNNEYETEITTYD